MNEGSHIAESEGVTKFRLILIDGAAPDASLLTELLAWRTLLFRLQLTGQDPKRYGGLSYGNVSRRLTECSFLISGTQTGGKEHLGAEDFCQIMGFDLSHNTVYAMGTTPPSSESLTHAAIYQANPACRSVLHVHSPEIWQHFRRIQLPATAETIPYGTPAMAAAVGELVHDKAAGSIAMLGHRDGILSYGTSPEAAASSLLHHYAESFYA